MQVCPAFTHTLLTQQPLFEQLSADGQQRPPEVPHDTHVPVAAPVVVLQNVFVAVQTLPVQHV